jgi:hypothetical protein
MLVCGGTDTQAEVASSAEASVSVSAAMSTPTKPNIDLKNMTTSPIFKHDCTALDIINRLLSQALNPIERTLLTQLIRRELKTTNSNTITCTTKGQPIILQRIVKQRKETSSSIRSPTISIE